MSLFSAEFHLRSLVLGCAVSYPESLKYRASTALLKLTPLEVIIRHVKGPQSG